MELFIFILEMIGTVAFASSGAMTAIEKNMDILGVTVLGMTTAVGGGIIRDLILGINPPNAFQNPIYAIVSILVSALIFIIIRNNTYALNTIGKRQYGKIVIISDSIGLGIFTVVGVNVALSKFIDCNLFLLVFIGVITGVGGGILQDVMSDNIPHIFVKHVYASASIVGAIVCAILWPTIGKSGSMIIGAVVIIMIRILAAHYKWNLPKVKNVVE